MKTYLLKVDSGWDGRRPIAAGSEAEMERLKQKLEPLLQGQYEGLVIAPVPTAPSVDELRSDSCFHKSAEAAEKAKRRHKEYQARMQRA